MPFVVALVFVVVALAVITHLVLALYHFLMLVGTLVPFALGSFSLCALAVPIYALTEDLPNLSTASALFAAIFSCALAVALAFAYSKWVKPFCCSALHYDGARNARLTQTKAPWYYDSRQVHTRLSLLGIALGNAPDSRRLMYFLCLAADQNRFIESFDELAQLICARRRETSWSLPTPHVCQINSATLIYPDLEHATA